MKRDLAPFKPPNSELGALQVDKDCRGPTELFFQPANKGDAPGMLRVRTVAHVYPERICARTHQAADHPLIGRCGSERGENAYAACTGEEV